MRHRHSRLHSIHLGVERAETQGAFEGRRGAVRLALPESQESAEEPRSREVRIEYERLVDQADTALEVAGEVAERMAASRQRDGIVLAKLDGAASQADSLGALLHSIGHPAVDLAPDMAPRRHRMGRREIRIDLQRLTELAQRLVG